MYQFAVRPPSQLLADGYVFESWPDGLEVDATDIYANIHVAIRAHDNIATFASCTESNSKYSPSSARPETRVWRFLGAQVRSGSLFRIPCDEASTLSKPSPTINLLANGSGEYRWYGWENFTYSREPHFLKLFVPYWMVCPLLLISAVFLSWVAQFPKRIRRWARPTSAVCANCGYDIRATPERCPECGTVVPSGVPLREGGSSDTGARQA
jgi:hypothetical protein